MSDNLFCCMHLLALPAKLSQWCTGLKNRRSLAQSPACSILFARLILVIATGFSLLLLSITLTKVMWKSSRCLEKNQHFLIFPQCFQKPGLLGKELTHYHPIPHFDALKIYSCGKHCEKAISTFLTMFSILYGTYFSI